MKKEKRRYTSARERAEKLKTGFTSAALKLPEGIQMFQPKPGRYLLDIIPFVAGEGNPWADEGQLHWERTYWTHRSVGANGDTLTCPRLTVKERCPICEHRLRLMKNADEDDEELVKELSPKQRQLFQVINLKDPDKGIQLWDISFHLFGKMLDARLRNSEEDEGWENFFHLEGGLTLKVALAEKTYAGFTYVEAEAIDFRARGEDYDEEILDKGCCLDELILVPEYDDLKKTFLESEKDDDDEDDEPPKKKKVPVDDDEDDEPPKKKVPVDDDEDDEKPPKKKNKFAEDDDEDGEKPRVRAGHDDDEDDEPPKKKRHSDRDEA